MCLIAQRPAGYDKGNITEAVMEHNLRVNDDGFGLAWRDRGRLLHEKFGPSDSQPFRNLVEKIDSTKNEYVAHWRMATTGKPCKELSHPFKYQDRKDGEVLVFHNGIIPIQADPGESDTSQFVKHVLAKLQARWWDDKAFRWMVEESMGWSRLLVMTTKRTVRIGQGWRETDGIWYSTNPGGSCPTPPIVVHDKDIPRGKDAYDRWLDDDKDDRPYKQWLDAKNDDDDEADEEGDNALLLPEKFAYIPSSGWSDKGHWVSPLTEEKDGPDSTERYGAAVCDSCKTMGEYYIMDGKTYIDVPHGQIAMN